MFRCCLDLGVILLIEGLDLSFADTLKVLAPCSPFVRDFTASLGDQEDYGVTAT